jgi:hypothetical protein
MEPPVPGRSRNYLNTALAEHSKKMYEDNTNDGLHCKACDAKVLFAPCDVSIHETPPGGRCEGFGEVKQYLLPYCPNCEGAPTSTNTCIHVGTVQPGIFVTGTLKVTPLVGLSH